MPVRADGAVVPGGRRHIVKSGETGIAIARAYGASWSRIAEANKLPREAVLRVGQSLFIPTVRTTSRPTRPVQPDVDELITGSAPAAAPRPTPTPAPTPAPVNTAVPSLSWPVEGRVLVSRFGPKPGGRVNDGINIRAIAGQTVRAAADGEVAYVGDAIQGFGLMILIRHAGGVVTAYGHLEDSLVDRGHKVTRGQPIARAGNSGDAEDPQLHFQVRAGRRPLDPMRYLP